MKIRNLALIAACFAVQGCITSEMNSPTIVSEHRVQVREEQYFQELDIAAANNVALANIAHRYARQGSGGLVINVTYGGKYGTQSAMWANNQASRIAAALKRNGVHDVRRNILPIKGEPSSRLLVTYRSYDALAPQDCGVMPGFHGSVLEHDPDYKLGCSLESVYAMQIARPKDLAGQDDMGYGDGRRAANVAEYYRTGAPSGELGGESASGDE